MKLYFNDGSIWIFSLGDNVNKCILANLRLGVYFSPAFGCPICSAPIFCSKPVLLIVLLRDFPLAAAAGRVRGGREGLWSLLY